MFVRDSTGIQILGNASKKNAFDGFSVENTSGAALRVNLAKANTQGGFYLAQSSNNTLEGNTARSNAEDGFFLEATSLNNALLTNRAVNNDLSGFVVPQTTTGSGNTARNNGGLDCDQPAGTTVC